MELIIAIIPDGEALYFYLLFFNSHFALAKGDLHLYDRVKPRKLRWTT